MAPRRGLRDNGGRQEEPAKRAPWPPPTTRFLEALGGVAYTGKPELPEASKVQPPVGPQCPDQRAELAASSISPGRRLG